MTSLQLEILFIKEIKKIDIAIACKFSFILLSSTIFTQFCNSLFWNVNTEAVDAFSQNWSGDNNWLVPPIYAVIRTAKHVVACKAKGTLIIPKWTSAAYWPLSFSKHWSYHSYVKDAYEYMLGPCHLTQTMPANLSI
jgi:hypothetical protein